MAGRRLENAALALLSTLDDDAVESLARRRFERATNMSDAVAALQVLCHGSGAARTRALAEFHARWRDNRLVVDKWFAVQGMARREDVVEDVRALLEHRDFSLANPNRARALLASFAFSNPAGFHSANGEGHALLAEQILLLDRTNPQIAAGLVAPLARWARFAEPWTSSMRTALVRIREGGASSPDVLEIVDRALDEERSD